MTESENLEINHRLANLVEQLEEYKQVAGLVCLALDILEEVANDRTLTADELRAQIKLTVGDKNDIIANKEARQSQYSAVSVLFNSISHTTK